MDVEWNGVIGYCRRNEAGEYDNNRDQNNICSFLRLSLFMVYSSDLHRLKYNYTRKGTD